MRPRPLLASALLLLVSQLGCAAQAAPGDDAYALDEISREIPPKGKVVCPKVELVRYEGDVLRYHKPVKVFVGFAERLGRFEAVVRDVATEVYGRAPTKIVHMGTYNCRRIGGYPHLLSEHGLGNGIDVAGFDFARAPAGSAPPDGLPKALKRKFQVRMKKHWSSTSATGAVHARFLRTLAERLIARRDVFRVLLGPAWPGHRNHFHFDMAPFRLVAVFEEPEAAP